MFLINPKLKRPQLSGYNNNQNPIEKYIIRKSFDNNNEKIEKTILWNNRSDISSSFNNLHQFLDNYFDTVISDNQLSDYIQNNQNKNEILPKTKSEMFYKQTFNNIYPNMNHILPQYWHEIIKDIVV